jgi:hypothetical protein
MKEKFIGSIMSIEYSRQAFKIKRTNSETPIRFYADDCIFNKVLSFIGKTNLHGQKTVAKFEVQGRVLTKFILATGSINKTDTFLGFVQQINHAIGREPSK